MGEHGKKEQWHEWKKAMQDESMPAEERIRLLQEMKQHLREKMGKIDALLAKLKE